MEVDTFVFGDYDPRRKTADYIPVGKQLLTFASDDKWRHEFCTTLINWAFIGKPMEPLQLCTDYKIPLGIFREVCNKYVDIQSAMREVKLQLLCNRCGESQPRCFD